MKNMQNGYNNVVTPRPGGMRVKKRGGRGYEEVKFDKITERINILIREGGYGKTVNGTAVAQSTINSLYDCISTEELDYIAASVAESRKLIHPNYSGLAGRIMISNLHKTTPDSFSKCMEDLQSRLNIFDGRKMEFITLNAAAIDALICHDRDYKFGYSAYRTLEKQYLHTVKEPEFDSNGDYLYVDFDGNVSTDTNVRRKQKFRRRVLDRPQYMFMRVALEVVTAGREPEVFTDTIEELRAYYNALSEMRFIYATPTNFNSCTKFAQLNSCFLLNTADSIEEIMHTITNAALISKRAGGIGIAYHKIRCRGAEIKGTNGESSGIVPQIKIYNEDARTWNQGGGKRLGAFAIYLEVWHGDISAFLRLKLTQGADTERARDLFYALWVCDLFMIRARTDVLWSLFSDDTAPGLSEVFDGMRICTDCGFCDNADYLSLVRRGVLTAEDAAATRIGTLEEMAECSHCFITVDAFTRLYTRYEREGRAIRRVLPSTIIDAICEAQRDQGVPYVCFKDHVNRQSNHQNLGTIQSSNLCVVPETYILTDKGQHKIIDLIDKQVNIWNGIEFVQVTPRKTGDNQKIIKVNLSNGVTIECTEYHKFYLSAGYGKSKPIIKEAKDLKPGDTLIKYDLPIISEGPRFPSAYTHGLFCADGTYSQPKGAEKYTVPINAYIDDKIDWFAGLCDGDGTISQADTNYSLQVSSIHKDFLLDIKLMLQTIGIDSKVILSRESCIRKLPDGKGGLADFNCKTLYRLLVSSVELIKLKELGFNPHRLNIPEQNPQRNASHFIKVESLVDEGRISSTYCFTENKRGMGMFNGVLTGQCAEIVQWHSKDEYACCSLASVNLTSYVRAVTALDPLNGGGVITLERSEVIAELLSRFDFAGLHEYTKMIVRGLDRFVSTNKYPVVECSRNAHKYRPIGIGVQGLANVFMKLRIPFLSPEAERIDLEIFETMYHAALEASCELAETHGTYHHFEGSPYSEGVLRMDLWYNNQRRMLEYSDRNLISAMTKYGATGGADRYNIKLSGRYDWDDMRARVRKGIRNSLLIALMPTVTTSILLGNNESFEPLPSNIYTKSTLAGKATESNSLMIEHLIELGLWSDKMKNKIVMNDGNLAGISEVPPEVASIYSTVWEMKQTELMRRVALRHVFVDQAQSLNIHLVDNSNAYLRGVLFVGWELGNCTGSYYIRTRAAVEPLKNNIVELKNEEAKVEISVDGPVCTPGCDSCGS